MPPKRGIAARKKPSRAAKFVYESDDDDDDFVAASGTESVETAGSSGISGESNPLAVQKLSTEPSPPQADPGLPSRQDSAAAGGQSTSHASLQRTLFDDLENDDGGNPSAPTAGRAQNSLPDAQRSKDPRPKKTPKGHLPQKSLGSAAASQPSRTASLSNQLADLRVVPGAYPQPQSINQHEDSELLPDAGYLDKMSSGAYIPPNQQRHMRACMVCSIVRTEQQFKSTGCPNCDHFLELAGNTEAVQDCTSQVFEGLITVSDTKRSWVARWQRIEGYVPGVYATQVEGVLPEDAVQAAEGAGVSYIPRDGSVNEALPMDA